MIITKELRKWNTGRLRPDHTAELDTIADRIDERYRRDMATAQQVGINEGEDAAMREGWIKLPVDADGMLIHIGDEVEFFNGNHDHVKILALRESGWSVNYLEWNPASLRHHQPDSWERIIDDALHAFLDDDAPAAPTKEELVERCRRLAGETE